MYALGADIGGTFTDLTLLNTVTGEFITGKRLTNNEDPAEPILSGALELIEAMGISKADVRFFVHATTLVTNTVLERSGARIGMLTTKGFRDVLETGSEQRYDIYDLKCTRPEPLVSREFRRPITERMGADGRIVTALSEADVERECDGLKQRGVEAIAVCFLNAYRNPENELLAKRIIHRIDPGMLVSTSHELLPEVREYERFLVTVVNSYVQPKVGNYLASIERRLNDAGLSCGFYVMQSNGGLMLASAASRTPVAILESGPAAGTIYAASIASHLHKDKVISFDMGGTTAKTALVHDYVPKITNDVEFARVERFKKGSGWNIRVPSVDLIEIGAGGGSIASVNAMGLLKVGPRSAGSEPGPVCYGRNGQEPTVTDADLVLGFLDPNYFLGGKMKLDKAAAEAAIEVKLAKPLNLSVLDAAWGVHDLVNESMALASRVHILEHGEDPRTHTVIAFGGAGPVHAYAVAEKLDVDHLVFPPAAGVASALGMLLAAPKIHMVQTHYCPLRLVDWNKMKAEFDQLAKKAELDLQDIGGSSVELTTMLDLRYAGQGYEVSVELGSDVAATALPDVHARFEATYEKLCGPKLIGYDVEVINLRLVAAKQKIMPVAQARLRWVATAPRPASRREVYFGPQRKFLSCDIQLRRALKPEASGVGPTIIEDEESTLVIGPNQSWAVDEDLNIVVNTHREHEDKHHVA